MNLLKRRWCVGFLSGLCWLALGLELSYGIGIEIAPAYWQAFASGFAAHKGASLDLKSDLNYDRADSFYGRIKLDLPLFLPNLYLTATQLSFDGKNAKSLPFKFGDAQFSASIPFESSFRLDHYDATLFYGLPMLKTATLDRLDILFGVNLRLIDFKGEVSQPQSSLKASKSASLPIPMGFLNIVISPVKRFKLTAEIKGIGYEHSRYIDFSGSLRIRFLKFLFLSGGYRYENIKIDQNEIASDIEFRGPFAEVGFEF